eukprot:COSAG02_NODE_14633_length_1252_cov_1.608846_1_plen_40_part_10
MATANTTLPARLGSALVTHQARMGAVAAGASVAGQSAAP